LNNCSFESELYLLDLNSKTLISDLDIENLNQYNIRLDLAVQKHNEVVLRYNSLINSKYAKFMNAFSADAQQKPLLDLTFTNLN